MQIIVKTTPQELTRARKWWKDLEMQWKWAYNEAVFGKGPTAEPPHDDALMVLLIQANSLRFAGPGAIQPNVTTVLTNLSGLIPLYHLTYLSLSNMLITHIDELVRFTKLKHLFLYENRIQSIQGLAGLLQLEELYLQHNSIKDLKPLAKLTHLKTVYLTHNQITELHGLTAHHATHMKKLYIQPNHFLPDREIIRFQNEVGIICRQG